MSKVFISYRRADSAASCGRIYDRLSAHFGKDAVFKDVDSIPIGVNFRSLIAAMIQQCAVQLVIIGPSWLDITNDQGQRRLDDPDDLVRIEVEAALQRGIPVIPVLVQDATMPTLGRLPDSLQPLVSQNGVVVRYDPDFDGDVRRLIRALEGWMTGAPVDLATRAADVASSTVLAGASVSAASSPVKVDLPAAVVSRVGQPTEVKKAARQFGLPPRAAHYFIWFTLFGAAALVRLFGLIMSNFLIIGFIIVGLVGVGVMLRARPASRINVWFGRAIGALSIALGLYLFSQSLALGNIFFPIFLGPLFLGYLDWFMAYSLAAVLVGAGAVAWWYGGGTRDLATARLAHYQMCVFTLGFTWIVLFWDGGLALRDLINSGVGLANQIEAVLLILISVAGLLISRSGIQRGRRRRYDGIIGLTLIVVSALLGLSNRYYMFSYAYHVDLNTTPLAAIGLLAGLATLNLALRSHD